jgi:hypothetical protein
MQSTKASPINDLREIRPNIKGFGIQLFNPTNPKAVGSNPTGRVLTTVNDFSDSVILPLMTPEDPKAWRGIHGYTQAVLARALGAVPLTVTRWKTGRRGHPVHYSSRTDFSGE